MITDEQVQAALDWLEKTIDARAEYEVAFKSYDELKAKVISDLTNELSDNMSEVKKKSEATSHPNYEEYLNVKKKLHFQYLKHAHREKFYEQQLSVWKNQNSKKFV